MDLTTIRKKLEAGDYSNASAFQADFDLMIKNCMTFNPVGTPVNIAGSELRKLFYEKWANLPPLKMSVSEDEDEEDEDDSEDERDRSFAPLLYFVSLTHIFIHNRNNCCY